MHDLGRRVKAAVIVVSVAALGGSCTSSDDEPATLPDAAPSATESATTSPTPEATASPSPTPTADPTAALEAEILGFFEEYTRAIDRSWTSEDVLAQRRAMFSDSCVSCLAGYEFAERVHAEGSRSRAASRPIATPRSLI